MDVVVAVLDFVFAYVQKNWWWFVIAWLFLTLILIDAYYMNRIKSGKKLTLEDDYDGALPEAVVFGFCLTLGLTVVFGALAWLLV
jgi:hypothetical protein